MGEFLFGTPWGLLALVPVLGVIVWRALATRRRPTLKVAAVGPMIHLPRTIFARVPWIPQVFGGAGLLLAALVLGRPQVRTANPRDVSVEGIDIVVALDLSTSMRAADFQPRNRIYVAKQVLKEFVDTRTADRVGLVVFASEAFTQCPLTLDHAVLQNIIDQVKIGVIEDGTAIGNGVATAVNRLRQSDAKSKVVILITDGDNNAGNISPLEAAQMAKSLGVRVYTILVGKGGRVPYPVTAVDGEPYQMVEVGTNPDLLKDIANKADGAFYLATDQDSLRKSLHDILDSLEKTRLYDAGVVSVHEELAPWFLIPAVLLILMEMLLRTTRYRRFP